MTKLAQDYSKTPTKIREIAASEGIPEKFLELILLELKMAQFVESLRGAHGGYRLKRSPARISMGEIIRTIDGPLAPMGDAKTLHRLIRHDKKHTPLYRVFPEVRDATVRIPDHTTLADLCCCSPQTRK